jgi:hypothetical protein
MAVRLLASEEGICSIESPGYGGRSTFHCGSKRLPNAGVRERRVACIRVPLHAACSMLNGPMMDEPINNQFTSN